MPPVRCVADKPLTPLGLGFPVCPGEMSFTWACLEAWAMWPHLTGAEPRPSPRPPDAGLSGAQRPLRVTVLHLNTGVSGLGFLISDKGC